MIRRVIFILLMVSSLVFMVLTAFSQSIELALVALLLLTGAIILLRKEDIPFRDPS